MTKTTLSINELNYTLNTIERLRKISKSLRKYNEHQCNYGELTKRQLNIQNKLTINASQLALDIGYQVYFQNDPRGCALYLVDGTMNDANYNNGIALY